jgi:Ca2+-binding EF-hand superfamily protein
MSPIVKSILACLAILVIAPATAQDIPRPSAPQVSATTQYLASRLTAGMTLANYLQSLRIEFAQLDADGDGVISPADVALHDAVAAAAMRAAEVQQIMSADLDGDGVVTEDEVRWTLRYRNRMQGASQAANPRPALGALPQNRDGLSEEERLEQEVRRLMAADTSKKGRITWEDAIASIKARPGYAQAALFGSGQRARQLLTLAGDGRDSVTLAELLAKGEAFFRTVDTDGNGTISLDELQAYQQAAREQSGQPAREQTRRQAEEVRARKEAEAQAACTVPKASDAAKVILLGAYETEALSDTTIDRMSRSVRGELSSSRGRSQSTWSWLRSDRPYGVCRARSVVWSAWC